MLWILLWVTARDSPMNWFFGLSPSRNPFVVGSALRTFFEGLGTLGAHERGSVVDARPAALGLRRFLGEKWFDDRP
jgi:hypothetical protein